jgi:hypothetical protein
MGINWLIFLVNLSYFSWICFIKLEFGDKDCFVFIVNPIFVFFSYSIENIYTPRQMFEKTFFIDSSNEIL